MIKRHSIATVCCVMLIGLAGLCGCGSSSDTKKDTVGITKEATSNVDALGEPTDHLQLAYAKTTMKVAISFLLLRTVRRF